MLIMLVRLLAAGQARPGGIHEAVSMPERAPVMTGARLISWTTLSKRGTPKRVLLLGLRP